MIISNGKILENVLDHIWKITQDLNKLSDTPFPRGGQTIARRASFGGIHGQRLCYFHLFIATSSFYRIHIQLTHLFANFLRQTSHTWQVHWESWPSSCLLLSNENCTACLLHTRYD